MPPTLHVPQQEVYRKLEEPDGLAGLSKLRSGGARLADQVLAAEKAGSWSEALSLHEQVALWVHACRPDLTFACRFTLAMAAGLYEALMTSSPYAC